MDDTTICNMALGAVDARSSISNMQEESEEARQCALHYAVTRDELLRDYRWNFAEAEIALAVLKSATGTPGNPSGAFPQPPGQWLYEYSYPSDCLAIRQIKPLPAASASGGSAPPIYPYGGAVTPGAARMRPVKYRLATDLDSFNNRIRVLLTNQAQAVAEYTARIVDPNIFDPDFITAFVGRLAAKICIPVSGDKELMKLAVQAGQLIEAKAAANSENEGEIQIIDRDAEWIAARSEGGGSFPYPFVGEDNS